MPAHVLRENEWNARGYWEPALALDINDAFLDRHGSSWWDPKPLRPAAVDDLFAEAFVTRIASFLRSEYPSDGSIVIKDPRISGLFPFWRRAAERCGFTVKALQVARHPDAVAASMRHRDGTRRELSHLLWLKYNLLSLADSSNVPHCVISYDELLRDWEAVVQRCIADLNLDLVVDGDARDRVAGFLTPALRHHQANEPSAERSSIGSIVNDVAAALDAMPHEPDTASLLARYLAIPAVAPVLPTAADLSAMPVTSRMIGATDDVQPDGGGPVSIGRLLVIGPHMAFNLRGWALRTDGNVAVDEILVSRDGEPIATAAPEHRHDLLGLYGGDAGLCGFRARVGALETNGAHRIEVHALSGGRRTSIGSFLMHVVEPANLQPTPCLHLAPFGRRIADSGSTLYELTGWGIDPVTSMRLDGAALLIDDERILPCDYGIARPDVQQAFDAPDQHCGFTATLDLDRLTRTHRVRLLSASVVPSDQVWVSDRYVEVTAVP